MRWFKLSEGILFSRQLQRCPPSAFRLWVCLQAATSWCGGALPADRADLAFLLHMTPRALERRLDALVLAGLVEIGDGGEIHLIGAVEGPEATGDRPVPLSPAERTRRWRESRRERDARDEAGDEAGDDAATAVTPQEKEKIRRDEDSSRVTRGVSDDLFETFWAAYPARDGDNPRQPAEAAFRRAVAAGADPERLIEGARRYAAAVAGREGRYIASAVRWLGESRWRDGAAKDMPSVLRTSPAEAPGVWISADTEAGRAWAEHYRSTKGKTPPVDAKGGWRFPAPMPPAVEVAA